MRHWYIVNNYGQYEGKDKTFEGAFYKVMSRKKCLKLKHMNIG